MGFLGGEAILLIGRLTFLRGNFVAVVLGGGTLMISYRRGITCSGLTVRADRATMSTLRMSTRIGPDRHRRHRDIRPEHSKAIHEPEDPDAPDFYAYYRIPSSASFSRRFSHSHFYDPRIRL